MIEIQSMTNEEARNKAIDFELEKLDQVGTDYSSEPAVKDAAVMHEWRLESRYRPYESFEEEVYYDVTSKRDNLSQG